MIAKHRTRAASRRGISLMEVLISIGIVAIGLTSAMSLIPAGKSEAGKAVVYDRGTTMAMNGMADALTFGLARPDSYIATTGTAATVVFDPAGLDWDALTSNVATVATLKSQGVLATAASTSAAAAAVGRLFTQGRDDVAYKLPATADDLPTNRFINGARAFDGRMSSLIAITEADSGTPPLAAGDLATISVVVFHNRDLATPTLSGTIDAAGYVTLSSLPADRTLKSIMRPGAVVCYTGTTTAGSNRLRFAQLAMASVDTTSNAMGAYVTFYGRQPPASTTAITVLNDSVGLAEMNVCLEGFGPFGQ